MRHLRVLALAAFIASSAAPALAQSIPGMGGGSSPLGSMMGGGGSSMGSMGSMMGGGLPSLSSASSGNVTGVLGYCVQNNLVQGGGATGALSTLTGRSGMTSSSGYAQGQQGILQTGGGKTFSMSSLSQPLKTKMCDMVLQHAQSML